MKSLRLEAVASLVKENCNVLDVGTDHAYLPIILSNPTIYSISEKCFVE